MRAQDTIVHHAPVDSHVDEVPVSPPGWPPAPPSLGYWTAPPPPRRRPGRRAASAAAALALVLVGMTAGATWAAMTGSRPATSSPGSPATSAPIRQDVSGGGAAATASPVPTPASAPNAEAIARQVDPAVVDLTGTIPGGRVAGTGIVVSSTGRVFTNDHVVAGVTQLQAQVGGTGRTYSARVVAADSATDVAVVQLIGASGLATVTLGDSSAVSVGDPVVAIGNALGRGGTPAVASGRVLALGRTVTASDQSGGAVETLTGMIEINARILPGDSGGPLVDASGQVVGMDTAASTGRGRLREVATQAFAIPINAVELAAGSAGAPAIPAASARGVVGVRVVESSAQGTPGAVIVSVVPGSAAESAGLMPGDTIVGLDGRTVRSPSDLSVALDGHHPGDTVRLSWVDAAGTAHDGMVQLTA